MKRPTHVVPERAVAVDTPPDGVRDSFVEHRQIQARRGVQMIEALRDGPGVGRGAPGELIVSEWRDQRIRVLRHRLELPSEIVDLRREREWTPSHAENCTFRRWRAEVIEAWDRADGRSYG